MNETIQLGAEIAATLQPGDKFDVINISPDGVEVVEGNVVSAAESGKQESRSLAAMLAATMGGFAAAASEYVGSGQLRRLRVGNHANPNSFNPHHHLTPRQRAARAKFKAERASRKAHYRAARNGKGKA
ncbi:MAG: hypothetical protein ACXWF2_10120 [Usitatibacter sp.]